MGQSKTRIEHKLVSIGGFNEWPKFPGVQKAPAGEVTEAGVVYFDRGKSGFSFRCYDASQTFETKLADLLKIVIVQMSPERSEAGYSYLRIVRNEGKGKSTYIDLLESPHGPNEYDVLGRKLAELFALPLETTPSYD
jgi:hypothetical protein